MQSLIQFFGSTSEEEYKKKYEKAQVIDEGLILYGSILVLLLLLTVAVYFVKNGRNNRFEWTILFFIFLKYTIYILLLLDVVREEIIKSDTFTFVLGSLSYTSGPIMHWIYVSQYIKTCCLSTGIVKRAYLLLMRHRTVIDNNYETTSECSDFVRNHMSIDRDMQTERDKSRSVHRIFLVIDILIQISLPVIYGFIMYYELYQYKRGADITAIRYVTYLFTPALDAIFSLLLVIAALYLTK